MKIYGHEYKLRFSVGAMLEIAKLCPGGKIEDIDKMMDLETEKGLEFIAKMTVIMEKYGRIAQAFEAGITVDNFETSVPRMTEEMVMSLEMEQLTQLMDEVFAARKIDTKTTVETAPAKKKKPAERKGTESV